MSFVARLLASSGLPCRRRSRLVLPQASRPRCPPLWALSLSRRPCHRSPFWARHLSRSPRLWGGRVGASANAVGVASMSAAKSDGRRFMGPPSRSGCTESSRRAAGIADDDCQGHLLSLSRRRMGRGTRFIRSPRIEAPALAK